MQNETSISPALHSTRQRANTVAGTATTSATTGTSSSLTTAVPTLAPWEVIDPNTGNTLLHLAIDNRLGKQWEIKDGSLETVKFLVAQGFNVNAQNKNLESPLLLAVRERNPQIVEFLLKNGADVLLQDNNKFSPASTILFASGFKHWEILQLFFQHAADKMDVNLTDAEGNSPLMSCIIKYDNYDKQEEFLKIIDFLLAKADVNLENSAGETALYFAIQKNLPAVVEKLLNHKANPNRAKSEGTRPLHVTTEAGSEICIKLLLQAGASPFAQRQNGDTPLQIAIEQGLAGCVKLLLDAQSLSTKHSKINDDDKRKKLEAFYLNDLVFTEKWRYLQINGLADTQKAAWYAKYHTLYQAVYNNQLPVFDNVENTKKKNKTKKQKKSTNSSLKASPRRTLSKRDSQRLANTLRNSVEELRIIIEEELKKINTQERPAFQQALGEWRQQNGNNSIAALPKELQQYQMDLAARGAFYLELLQRLDDFPRLMELVHVYGDYAVAHPEIREKVILENFHAPTTVPAEVTTDDCYQLAIFIENYVQQHQLLTVPNQRLLTQVKQIVDELTQVLDKLKGRFVHEKKLSMDFADLDTVYQTLLQWLQTLRDIQTQRAQPPSPKDKNKMSSPLPTTTSGKHAFFPTKPLPATPSRPAPRIAMIKNCVVIFTILNAKQIHCKVEDKTQLSHDALLQQLYEWMPLRKEIYTNEGDACVLTFANTEERDQFLEALPIASTAKLAQ